MTRITLIIGFDVRNVAVRRRKTAMRVHNGVLVVTEPVGIVTLALTGSDTALPSLPSGDLGREIKQVTIRGRDVAWEWRFLSVSNDYFWMGVGDTIILPIRDRTNLEDFRLRRAAESAGTADIRIIYEA